MRHLDLSFEGRQVAERDQLDNGKLPHGGYRGSRRHPPCILSYDKGREFQHALHEEMDKIMETEEVTRHGSTPAWSILVHREASYTDESPLITKSLLAASKHEQINGITLFNRESLLPKKCKKPQLLRPNGLMYYRPNRLHQYLSATELKNSAKGDINIMYGRPTRTTLLRARQRSNSAPLNKYEKRRENLQKLDEIKSPCPVVQNTEYLRLQTEKEGESLHSYLTGARYNRANCLDSKSVEHTGLFMPRHNPALGSFFTGPKGQEYLQGFDESPRDPNMPIPPTPPPPSSPQAGKRRPMTAPSPGRGSSRGPVSPFRSTRGDSQHRNHPNLVQPRSADRSKYKYLKLNVVGSRLPIGFGFIKESGMRLPSLQGPAGEARSRAALDETYRVNQPPPTPTTGILQARAMAIIDVDGRDDSKDVRTKVEVEKVVIQNEIKEDSVATSENNADIPEEDTKFDQLIVNDDDRNVVEEEEEKKDPDAVDPKVIESMVNFNIPVIVADETEAVQEEEREKEPDVEEEGDEIIDLHKEEDATEEPDHEVKEDNLDERVEEISKSLENDEEQTKEEDNEKQTDQDTEGLEKIDNIVEEQEEEEEEEVLQEKKEDEEEEAEGSGKDEAISKEVRFFITEEGGENAVVENIHENDDEEEVYEDEDFEQEEAEEGGVDELEGKAVENDIKTEDTIGEEATEEGVGDGRLDEENNEAALDDQNTEILKGNEDDTEKSINVQEET